MGPIIGIIKTDEIDIDNLNIKLNALVINENGITTATGLSDKIINLLCTELFVYPINIEYTSIGEFEAKEIRKLLSDDYTVTRESAHLIAILLQNISNRLTNAKQSDFGTFTFRQPHNLCKFVTDVINDIVKTTETDQDAISITDLIEVMSNKIQLIESTSTSSGFDGKKTMTVGDTNTTLSALNTIKTILSK